MYLINTEEVKEPENYSDFRTLQEWGLETQCKLRFPGSAFAPDTTSSIDIDAGVIGCLKLTDSGASTNRGAVSFSLPSVWNRGSLKVSMSYTASAAGGNYVVRMLMYTASQGQTINTGSTSAQDTVSAVGGAWELGEHTFSTTRTVNPTDTFATVQLRRFGTDAADTDSGDLCIAEITVTYEPER